MGMASEHCIYMLSFLLIRDFHIFSMSVTVAGPVEADPEYRLIVDSNNMTVEIDNEISKENNVQVYWQRNE